MSEAREKATDKNPDLEDSGVAEAAAPETEDAQGAARPSAALAARRVGEPPPPIPGVDQLLDKDIPPGQLGIITDDAVNSVDGAEAVTDPRFAPVQHADISLPVRRANMMLRKSAFARSSTMMEREVLKEVIQEDGMRWRGCITLPVSVVFFTLYVMVAVTHEDVSYSFLSALPMVNHLESNAADVRTPDGVWDFIQTSYVPYFFKQYDASGNKLDRDRWSVIGKYSQLVGMVAMELQRSEQESCPNTQYFTCFPQDKPTDAPFGRPLASIKPPVVSVASQPWSLNGTWTWWNPAAAAGGNGAVGSLLRCADEGFSTRREHCTGHRRLESLRMELQPRMPPSSSEDKYKYMFYLDSHDEYSHTYNRVEYLKDRGWFDPQSTVMTLTATLLNNHVDNIPRVIYTQVQFFFSRGGGVFSKVTVQSRPLTFFLSNMCYVWDVLFLLFMIVRTIGLVNTMAGALQMRTIWPLVNGTFALTFTTICMGWVNTILMLVMYTWQSEVKDRLEGFYSNPSSAASEALSSSTDKMMGYASGFYRPLVSMVTLLFLCQIIVALQWQPRLATVTSTLMACSSDLFHYAIVWVMTILGFSLSGMVIFGRRVIDFVGPEYAVFVCLKIAVESEYDWEQLSAREWWTAFIWVFLFLVGIVMIIMNMLLAIVMDVYAEVRMHSGDNLTIFGHLLYIYRRVVYRSQWVPDAQLMDQVQEMPQHITLLEIRQAFPEMHYFQLEFLQSQCMNKAAKISRIGVNKTYTAQIAAAILFGLEEVQGNLGRLKSRGWMAKGLEVGSDESREWVKDVFSSIAVQSHWMSLAAKHISMLQLRIQGVTVEEEDERKRQTRLKAGRSVKARASQVA